MERQEEQIRRVMTQGSVEVAVALLVHLVGLGFYVYVHVLDGTNLKKTEGKGVPGIDVFGGRWKFLTYINLVNFHSFALYVCTYTRQCIHYNKI